MVRSPLRCDSSGNLLLYSWGDGSEAIHKIDLKGKRLATFKAETQPNVQITHIGHFALSKNGEVAVVVFTKGRDRYVFNFGSDGNLKSTAKIDLSFIFLPYQIASLPNDTYVITGLRSHSNPTPERPFTGLFSSDGRLIREIEIPDDKTLTEAARSGDPLLSSSDNPNGNLSVTSGNMDVGEDGNVYLMRRYKSAIVSVLNPAGEVVRRFEVSSGQDGFYPREMHVARTRIAFLFWNQDMKRSLIKVVDLEGTPVATYEQTIVDDRPTWNLTLACYIENSESFVFLKTIKDKKLGLNIAQPK